MCIYMHCVVKFGFYRDVGNVVELLFDHQHGKTVSATISSTVVEKWREQLYQRQVT